MIPVSVLLNLLGEGGDDPKPVGVFIFFYMYIITTSWGIMVFFFIFFLTLLY